MSGRDERILARKNPASAKIDDDGGVLRCAVCGDEATVRGGLCCENGHLVCAKPACRTVGSFSEIRRVICPICARLLR